MAPPGYLLADGEYVMAPFGRYTPPDPKVPPANPTMYGEQLYPDGERAHYETMPQTV